MTINSFTRLTARESIIEENRLPDMRTHSETITQIFDELESIKCVNCVYGNVYMGECKQLQIRISDDWYCADFKSKDN